MKTKIIYTTPNGKILIYTTSSKVFINGFLIEFYDEIEKINIRLPLDRCQIHEVME